MHVSDIYVVYSKNRAYLQALGTSEASVRQRAGLKTLGFVIRGKEKVLRISTYHFMVGLHRKHWLCGEVGLGRCREKNIGGRGCPGNNPGLIPHYLTDFT
jgi:hypothetical protein